MIGLRNTLVLLLVTEWTAGSLSAEGPQVEILRDRWGIAHVFADTDAAAFYGLGYATAEDRAFQMTYSLRMIQGRVAEILGNVPQTRRDDTTVDHDRKMRTFGFYRGAQRTAANLDVETRELLQAYCDGVNAYFRDRGDRLHPLFAQTGLKPEPWTPADCLASWWQFAQFFATDGTRDLIAGRNVEQGQGSGRGAKRPAAGRAEGRGGPPQPPRTDLEPMPPDDEPAVVKRTNASPAWIERVQRYASQHGLTSDQGSGADGPKFSHAWVVGGPRTTTGSAVLVSDPQTPVRNPSLLYQFHIQGKTFNARGVGVAGSPALLIGFTNYVAWGVTALGADQADLFLIETDSEHPAQYRFDGQWLPMTVYQETIQVKGGSPIEYAVRETHLGPVATEFCFAQASDGEVVLKRIPICETDRETIQGALAMMRARDVNEFDQALAGWRFPSVNIVFGDRQGNIGYRALAAIPLRSRHDSTHGRGAQPAHSADRDWREMIPYDLLPGVINPADGFLYSGNHRPVESWYPLPLGAMTGTGGDTIRSWRLRERLQAQQQFTPEAVRDIHYDAVNPARRDMVRIGLHLRDQLQRELSADARNALTILEPWWRDGASVALDRPGAEVAVELNTFFRFVRTDLAQVYGGGESGLAYFLKSAVDRLQRDPKAEISELEQEFIDQSLAEAWRSAQQKYGQNPETWNAQARQAVSRQQLGYYEALHGFPALDRREAISLPALTVTDGGTIACQTAQSYTQWVPMHDPDTALCLLPIGQSEWPGNPARTSTLEVWGAGQLHAAPLSRKNVEALCTQPPRTLRLVENSANDSAAPPEVWLCAGDRILDLLDEDAQWSFVREHLVGIKLYVGQLRPHRGRSAEATAEQLKRLVELVRANGFQVAVELGGCLDFSPMDATAGEWSARSELADLATFYAVGGRVDYLDIDGPIRRLLHPENRRDGKHFESIELAADELVDALRIHRDAHPETKYWLLTNFPNWGWRGDVSYHARGPNRQDYGDYDRVVRIVLEKLRAANIALEGVTVDNPYEYLVGERRSATLSDPKSVDWIGRVRSYEQFTRDQGLAFNLIVNSEGGGQESDERFFRETLRMVDAYRAAGGQPTRWFVQSWYAHPKQMVPETSPHSMTALVKAVIERLGQESAEVVGETPASEATPSAISPQRLQLEGLAPPAAGHFGVLGFSIRAPWMTGCVEQRFPETLHSSLGLHFIDHDRRDMRPLAMLEPFPTWQPDEATGAIEYSHRDATGLVYGGCARPDEDRVVMEYRIRNETGKSLHGVSAQMCTNLGRAEEFLPTRDVSRTFTWIRGGWTSLADTTPDLSRPGRHPWLLIEVQGAHYTGPREYSDGWWVADEIADHGIIARVTRDSAHVAAVCWDSAPMVMSNSGIPCLHAGPVGGVSLAPGEEIVWRGIIYLMANDPDALLRRYQSDMGK